MSVKVTWRSNEARALVTRNAPAALQAGAEFLLEQANRTIPLEESTLEKSGKVTVSAATLEASVSYDGPYARRQHEDLTFRHAPGRRAKWLQRTLAEQSGRISEVIASKMRGGM